MSDSHEVPLEPSQQGFRDALVYFVTIAQAGGAMSDSHEVHERIPEALLRRLERLEQEYRRLRGTNRLLVVGLAVLLGTAAATVVSLALRLPRLSGDVVQARSFALRDAKGRLRGVFGR